MYGVGTTSIGVSVLFCGDAGNFCGELVKNWVNEILTPMWYR